MRWFGDARCCGGVPNPGGIEISGAAFIWLDVSPLIVAVAGLLVLGFLAAGPLVIAWRRRAIRRQPFPSAWRGILWRRVPAFRALPVDLQLQLKQHIQVFLAEKPFIGCRGLVITDDVRVTIAAQACLLILNRRNHYFPALREILVYPGAFVVNRPELGAGGVQHERRDVLSGESWVRGQVMLSWEDVLQGAATPDDGHNVVIHEFAHQLDQEKGAATGAPMLARRWQGARWSRVLGEAFDQLQASLARGEPTLINAYGATSPAEFFAVASEVFFEQPISLLSRHPALYAALSGYYRVDPRAW